MLTILLFVIVGLFVGAISSREEEAIEKVFAGLAIGFIFGLVGLLVSMIIGYAVGENKQYTFTLEEFATSGFNDDDATTLVVSNSGREEVVVEARVLEDSIWFLNGHDTKSIIYYTD